MDRFLFNRIKIRDPSLSLFQQPLHQEQFRTSISCNLVLSLRVLSLSKQLNSIMMPPTLLKNPRSYKRKEITSGT